MSEKNLMALVVPKAGPPIHVPASKALTFLLGKNNAVFAYEGSWEEALQNNKITSTNYSGAGMRELIRNKQKQLGKTDAVNIVIKPFDQSSYKNTVDVLDEMLINGVTKYAIVDPHPDEMKYVKKKEG